MEQLLQAAARGESTRDPQGREAALGGAEGAGEVREEPAKDRLLTEEALGAQLREGLLALLEVELHRLQNLGNLHELHLAVVDDLEQVAPRVTDVEARWRGHRNARRDERLAHGLLVVDDEAEMPLEVRRLGPASRECDELIAHVD